MPRYPSSRGVPAEHVLSDEDLEHERQARWFQREVNHERYLAWHTVARRIKPNQRYVVVSYGYIREALLGQEILDHYSQLVNARSCTYSNELQPVPDNYQIPVEDLWLTYVDERGHTVVQNAEQDVWDHTWFTATTPEMETRINRDRERTTGRLHAVHDGEKAAGRLPCNARLRPGTLPSRAAPS